MFDFPLCINNDHWNSLNEFIKCLRWTTNIVIFLGCTFNKQILTLTELFKLELIIAIRMACFVASLACVLDHLTSDKYQTNLDKNSYSTTASIENLKEFGIITLAIGFAQTYSWFFFTASPRNTDRIKSMLWRMACVSLLIFWYGTHSRAFMKTPSCFKPIL